MIPVSQPVQDLPNRPLDRAVANLAREQHSAGYWEAEMVWNTMLLSQNVLVRRITGRWPLDTAVRDRMLLQYRVTQRADGSWPMHGEGEGYVFMTALAYVALRVLGLGPEDEMVARARAWLAQAGGVLAVPTWGKLWLAMVGLYGYEGVNPIPPELFLLPDSLPIHPNNFYCHTRYIYLGIAYLYGKRFCADLGPLAGELRAELYPGVEYQEIDFTAHRHDLAATDLYVRPSLPLRAAYDALVGYERLPWKPLRGPALAHCLERIRREQEASRGQGLSPVNGLLNCLALFSETPGDPLLQSSLDAMESWKWEDAEEGIRYCGAHSTAWDTAFAMRAILAGPDRARSAAVLKRGYRWLAATQMQEELPHQQAERRDPIVGGWCFSDGQHRWPVSDCTAEALTAILETHAAIAGTPSPAAQGRSHTAGIEPEARLSDARIEQAVEFILRRQNDDGGFGSYERRRGSLILEWINPSEMYGNCMTERSYTECTASCVGALCRYRTAYPSTALAGRIDAAVARALALLRSRQRPDGSYAGFWGVNFTYGIFHIIEALKAAGVPATDPAIARAAEWLLVKQKDDGGWGEHWKSCLTDEYVEHPESQAAMTAWALLALLEAVDPRIQPVARAVECLTAMQNGEGAWPRQAQSGVFFQTAMLDYRLYKDYFPTWALARYQSLTR